MDTLSMTIFMETGCVVIKPGPHTIQFLPVEFKRIIKGWIFGVCGRFLVGFLGVCCWGVLFCLTWILKLRKINMQNQFLKYPSYYSQNYRMDVVPLMWWIVLNQYLSGRLQSVKCYHKSQIWTMKGGCCFQLYLLVGHHFKTLNVADGKLMLLN